MRVGIISKEEHTKGIVQALRDADYRVELLGGRPATIPSRVDVVVCRAVSCSHRGYDVAMEEKRAGTRPVLFEEFQPCPFADYDPTVRHFCVKQRE